jgi:hypothetical protein
VSVIIDVVITDRDIIGRSPPVLTAMPQAD